MKQIILAIIIYENFNRPKIYRYFEIVSHFFRKKKNHTLGIMQVSSAKIISDEESVEIGTKILINKYYELEKKYKKLVDKSEYNDRDFQIKLVNFYNLGYSYSNEIINIADEINDLEYNSNYKYLFFNNLNNDSKIKKLINKNIIKSVCKYFIKFLN